MALPTSMATRNVATRCTSAKSVVSLGALLFTFSLSSLLSVLCHSNRGGEGRRLSINSCQWAPLLRPCRDRAHNRRSELHCFLDSFFNTVCLLHWTYGRLQKEAKKVKDTQSLSCVSSFHLSAACLVCISCSSQHFLDYTLTPGPCVWVSVASATVLQHFHGTRAPLSSSQCLTQVLFLGLCIVCHFLVALTRLLRSHLIHTK